MDSGKKRIILISVIFLVLGIVLAGLYFKSYINIPLLRAPGDVTIIISQPAQGIAYPSLFFDINFSSTSSMGSIDKCWYTLDSGSSVNLNNCNNLIGVNSNAVGLHRLNLYVNDSAGNLNNKNISFWTTSTPTMPAVATPSINVNNICNPSSIQFSGSWTDVSFSKLLISTDSSFNNCNYNVVSGCLCNTTSSYENPLGIYGWTELSSCTATMPAASQVSWYARACDMFGRCSPITNPSMLYCPSYPPPGNGTSVNITLQVFPIQKATGEIIGSTVFPFIGYSVNTTSKTSRLGYINNNNLSDVIWTFNTTLPNSANLSTVSAIFVFYDGNFTSDPNSAILQSGLGTGDFYYMNNAIDIVNGLKPSDYYSGINFGTLWKQDFSLGSKGWLKFTNLIISPSGTTNIYGTVGNTFATQYAQSGAVDVELLNESNDRTSNYLAYVNITYSNKIISPPIQLSPTYYNIKQPPTSTYSATTNYEFNVTWFASQGTAFMNTVIIENDFNSTNGTLTNISLSPFSFPNDEYSYHVIGLPVGIYHYKWFGTDTLGQANYTMPTQLFVVNSVTTNPPPSGGSGGGGGGGGGGGFPSTSSSTNITFNITSNILGANVFINGNYVGLTPLMLSIAKGDYTLKLEKAGYSTLQEQISAQSDLNLYKTMQVNIQPEITEVQRPEQVYKLTNNNLTLFTTIIMILIIIVPITGYIYFRLKK